MVVAASVLAQATMGAPQAIAGEGPVKPAHEAAAALLIACRGGEPALLGVFEAVDGAIVFSLPGGGARAGEDAATTAERETLEETGYRVHAEQPVPTPAGAGVRVMRAHVVERQRSQPLSPEIIAAAWIDPARIPTAGWRFERDQRWVPQLFQREAPRDCG